MNPDSSLIYLAQGNLALAGVAAPLLPTLVPSSVLDRQPQRSAHWATALGTFALGIAMLRAVLITCYGPCHAVVWARGPISVDFRLDSLASLLSLLVSFLALIVIRYSANYLNGEPHQGRFTKWLCLTCGCVLLMVLSGNLLLFALAWSATSWCLHRLLVFYPERPGALLAARKKFIFSRLGDVCLLLVLILIYHEFHTWDFQSVFNASDMIRNSAASHLSLGLEICCYLLVIAALLKSAQFPFHSWLPDTMETPTPVSALMHAGVINAGGFLIVRLSPLITLCPGALALLTLLGGFTALFASLTMLTHASVKRALAFSTVAQMGFMMLECGLGAFSLAILHLVAHSLYKAHAFLSSGSMIALAKAKWVPVGRPHAHPGVLLASVLLALGVTWSASRLLGFMPQDDPSYSLLVLILLLSQAYMLWNLLSSSLRLSLLFWGVLMGMGLSLVYFALHRCFVWILKTSVHDQVFAWTDYHICAGLAVLLLFLAVLFFQTELPQWEQNRGYKTLYVHARNGFYFNTLANHLVMKIWPATSEPASNPSKLV